MQRKSLCRAPSSSCRRCLSRLARLGLGTALARHLQSLAASTAVPNLRRHMISPISPTSLDCTDIWALSVQCEVTMLLQRARHPSFSCNLIWSTSTLYIATAWPTCIFRILSHVDSAGDCARRSSPCRLASWTCEESCAHSIGSGSIHISVKLQ